MSQNPPLAQLSEWPEVPQSDYIVATVICILASLVVRLKALRREGLRHHYDQQGYDGQEPHGLIIGRRVSLPQC